ncbi:hypothetical protein D3C78_1925060 [compost metagenome]
MRGNDSANRRSRDTNDVLQVLCLLSKVSSTYRPNLTISCDIILSDSQELLYADVSVHNTDDIRSIHETP